MNATPPTMPQRPRQAYPGLPVTQLRVGRVVMLVLIAGGILVGGALWLLSTQARPLTTPTVDSTAWPAWLRQTQVYQPDKVDETKAAAPAVDPNAALLAKLAAIQADLERQRLELDALKKRPSGTTVIQQKEQPAVKTPPVVKPHAAMLYVAHDLKDATAPPARPEYVLAPGATKIPFILETKIVSDVEGYLTGRVMSNVYDTATGRHLLIPQGSTILGNDHANDLLYGNERMNTISLTLTLPDGRSIDLGRSPITDQQGVAGLTGDVNQHYFRLLAAVLIQGVLRGGTTAMNTAMANAAGAGQVASGIAGVGNQAAYKVTGPMLNTRPTITVEAGQLGNVILLKELRLPAVWE